MIKPIRSRAEYEEACAEVARLMGATNSSANTDRLELLALVVREYEAKNTVLPPPDPIDALLFRMEQKRLTPRDLIPYIGSRSKVSEILSRSRSLTLPMIRALNEGLGIPASVLIQQSKEHDNDNTEPDWTQFPRKEMILRGWIRDSAESVREFFQQLPPQLKTAVLYRKSKHIRSARKLDHFALGAWVAQVCTVGNSIKGIPKYVPGSLTKDFLDKLLRLTVEEDGPLQARYLLESLGIPLVIEPNLPHTYLDGAAILAVKERPIVALTLRYDRIDSFWFTLMHELGHVALHAEKDISEFVDDLDLEAKDDEFENEADEFAGETLIPSAAWQKSPASRLRSPEAVMHLAKALKINPAIVAGRMRHEWKAFRLFSNLVGHNQVRKLFTHVKWSD